MSVRNIRPVHPADVVAANSEIENDPGNRKSSTLKSAQVATLLLSIRNLRSIELGDILGDVDEISWNMMLDIYISEELGRPVVTSDLAITYSIPKTTLARYFDFLCDADLIVRTRDRSNRVRVLLNLTEKARTLVTGTLEKIAVEIKTVQRFSE
ncbi:hypothetical protein [Parasphingorhabdus sp.]|uniref:hypothetical protein n=1 Tax=Parasphingorhabdus sp. TaxID=2709688 RepID=UPI003267491C